MKGDHLPFTHHIARYCSGTRLTNQGCPAPTAFHLRPGETFLSVQWLEYLEQADRSNEIQEVVNALARNMHFGKTAKIAVLNVGQICNHVDDYAGYLIRVLHEPEKGNEAHSGIHDTIQDEMIIAELLAEKVSEVHAVKSRE
ncbi:MAG: hypothetical protein U5L00_07425 [Desulfovermiculus sp.]|nr:hypothetical protein [Desulfovermiculus sp.]